MVLSLVVIILMNILINIPGLKTSYYKLYILFNNILFVQISSIVLRFIHFYAMYLSLLLAYIHVHHKCALCPWRPEEATESPENRVGGNSKSHLVAGN